MALTVFIDQQAQLVTGAVLYERQTGLVEPVAVGSQRRNPVTQQVGEHVGSLSGLTNVALFHSPCNERLYQTHERVFITPVSLPSQGR